MSVKVSGWVWDQAMPPTEKLVLLALADHANHEGDNAYPSVSLLAKKTGLSERQVQRYLGAFVDQGMLTITGNESGGRGKSRAYSFTRYQKGDMSDTDTERVTCEKGDAEGSERVTTEQERVTPEVVKGDAAMSPEPLRTVNINEPPDNRHLPTRKTGGAHDLINAFSDEVGIKQPTNYRKAIGQATNLLKAGATPHDIRECIAWIRSQPFWHGQGIDMGIILSQWDRFVTQKNESSTPPLRIKDGKGNYTPDGLRFIADELRRNGQ